MLSYIARLRDRLVLSTCLWTQMERQHWAPMPGLFIAIDEVATKPPLVSRVILETETLLTCFIYEDGLFYFVLCDKPVSAKLIISYLEKMRREFLSRYGSTWDIVSGPLALFEFAPYMRKASRFIAYTKRRYNLDEADLETGEVSPMDHLMLTVERVLLVDTKASDPKTQDKEKK